MLWKDSCKILLFRLEYLDMLKIRLARYGVKRKPFYRIVVVGKEKKQRGKVIEILGFWKPSKKQVIVDKEKLLAWTKKGAFVNKSVEKLIVEKIHGKIT